jgi:alpha-galactosidase
VWFCKGFKFVYFVAENPWEWADEVGHVFRTHDDIIASWDSVLEILDIHAQVVQYGGPGHWADPGK